MDRIINDAIATRANDSITVRTASSQDARLVHSFIQKKAEFDRQTGSFSGTLQTSEEKIRDFLFSSHPFAYSLIAEIEGQSAGFALYYFRYSSFAGQPSIWLDDIYVDQERRRLGAGIALMRELSRIGRDMSCTHIEWMADTRNGRALKFYRRLGATLTERKANACYLTWPPSSSERS